MLLENLYVKYPNSYSADSKMGFIFLNHLFGNEKFKKKISWNKIWMTNNRNEVYKVREYSMLEPMNL